MESQLYSSPSGNRWRRNVTLWMACWLTAPPSCSTARRPGTSCPFGRKRITRAVSCGEAAVHSHWQLALAVSRSRWFGGGADNHIVVKLYKEEQFWSNWFCEFAGNRRLLTWLWYLCSPTDGWCDCSTAATTRRRDGFQWAFSIRNKWIRPSTVKRRTMLHTGESKLPFRVVGLTFNQQFICRAVVRELIETEEEFGRDLLLVVEHYIKVVDKKTTPKLVSDNKELIFGNFKQIAEFHNT